MTAAIGTEVVRMLATGEFQAHAREQDVVLQQLLSQLPSGHVAAVRSRRLWAAVDVIGRSGRSVCEGLMRRDILANDARGSTIRLAPPLVIDSSELEWAMAQLRDELTA